MKLPAGVQDQRLDRVVTELLRASGLEVSVREVRAALKEGRIRVEGRKVPPSSSAIEGADVDLSGFTPRASAQVAPEPELANRVSILFQDEQLIALAKPSGVPVAPLSPDERHTLLGAAIALAPEVALAGAPLEGGLGHRLDVETSGVVVFAKDPQTHARLREAFGANQVEKRYLALVHDPEGRWSEPELITALLSGRGARVRVVSSADEGLAAETRVVPLGESRRGLRWLELWPRTGRRHQLRVHLAYAGTPIVSDPVYGERHSEVPRLALHAAALTLLGRPTILAPLPDDLRAALSSLGFGLEALQP